MQYQILKTIIETSIGQFICQQCQHKLAENHLYIKSINSNSVEFSLGCPHCHAETLMHAVIGGAHPAPETHLESVLPKNSNALKDTDITIIEQQLRTNSSIEDFLR